MIVHQDEILNPTIRVPPKSAVKSLCRLYHNREKYAIKYSWNGHDFFIRHRKVTMAAAHAQHFFHAQIKMNPHSTIQIPELYHAWRDHDGTVYMIMEYVHLSRNQLATEEQRARAITEIISVPPPPGVFGSFDMDRIYHSFFKDDQAPIGYNSVEQVEAYLNRVLTFMARVMPRHLQVDFRDEPLLCYLGDVRREHFPLDINGNPWVVDFRLAGVLPESFMSYTLDKTCMHANRFSTNVRNTIPVQRSGNLLAMVWATGMIKKACDEFCECIEPS